ncbi:MAG: DUF366 family protein [Proteobacteria bacterium]|nr:DUF366 family protein [Pseudomonadota bacterium]
MQRRWIDREIKYDGLQLCSGWVREMTGIAGSAIAGFRGPADVPIGNMVDLEDVAANAPIFSKSMLHFIAEHEDRDLALAVARQRLLVAIAAEEIATLAPGSRIERRGDDIYEGDKKLSVSIATTSPHSSLIHFAINIVSEGTPVPTKGLAEYGIGPKGLADAILARYCEEIESMAHATTKVREVR